MKKINKMVNIVLIFTLLGVFLWLNAAYSSDATHLRVPIDITNDRERQALEKLSSKAEKTIPTAIGYEEVRAMAEKLMAEGKGFFAVESLLIGPIEACYID